MSKRQQRKSVSRSAALTIPELDNPKPPCSIPLLLHTRGEAMGTPLKGSSFGIAASLD